MSQNAVTFSLKPRWYIHPVDVQAQIMMAELARIFPASDWKRFFVLELTQQYNVHVHGILQYLLFTNKNIHHLIYDKIRASRIIGFSVIKYQVDKSPDPTKTWYLYITKDITKTMKDFESAIHPVFVDDFHLVHKYFDCESIEYEIFNARKLGFKEVI